MIHFLLILLLIVLIFCYFNYEDVLFRIYQVIFYRAGTIVRKNKTNTWLNVDIEGKRYDLFLPNGDGELPFNNKIIADNEELSLLPDVEYNYTLQEMGFRSGKIVVKKRGTTSYKVVTKLKANNKIFETYKDLK